MDGFIKIELCAKALPKVKSHGICQRILPHLEKLPSARGRRFVLISIGYTDDTAGASPRPDAQINRDNSTAQFTFSQLFL